MKWGMPQISAIVTVLVTIAIIGSVRFVAAENVATPIVPVAEPTAAPTEAPTEFPTAGPTAIPTVIPAETSATPAADELGDFIQASSLLATDGTVTVTVRNTANQLLPGACFVVYLQGAGASGTPGPPIAGQCDGREDGNADGQVTFVLPPGDYVVVETFAPQGYMAGVQAFITLGEGEELSRLFINHPGGVDLYIHKQDQQGNALGQACFSIYEDIGNGQTGLIVSATCDGPPGDPGDGINYFPGIAPGRYVAVETQVPAGYISTGNTQFSIASGNTEPVNVIVKNQLAASPGNLVIHKEDEHGQPLPGACFNIHQDAGGGLRGNHVAYRCDWDDGGFDGQFVITELAPGAYVLAESHAPDGYINGAKTTFTISETQATVLTIPNTPGGSNIAIQTRDRDTGALLNGACYSVFVAGSDGLPDVDSFVESRCDDSDGSTDGVMPFTGLAAGDYVLEQFAIQSGYGLHNGYIAFSVDGMNDEIVTVENARASTIDIDAIIRAIVAVIIAILASM